jgi:16S rRNA (adenine1518-N6/adenine1519-N6)-dimethyltransferase
MKIKANKRFGQNFLINNEIIEKIIEIFGPKPNDNILEIGPGLGALTKSLAKVTSNFNAVEIDYKLVEYLKTKNLPVIQEDILNFDFKVLKQSPIRIIGNLPYNISSQIIFKLIENYDIISDATLMVQLEMANRIAAKPNNKNYGRISVITSHFFESSVELIVPNNAFNPVPKVTSAIIKLKKIKQTQDVDMPKLSSIVKQAFQMRRKTLNNSLKDYKEAMQKANIDTSLRAENLSLKDYIDITKA